MRRVDTSKVYIFQCADDTYRECVEKQLFGASAAWPLEVKKGDLCCLYNIQSLKLFALWSATSNGDSIIVKNAWGGRFPFQVRVSLITSQITEIPKDIVMAKLTKDINGRVPIILNQENAAELLTKISILRT